MGRFISISTIILPVLLVSYGCGIPNKGRDKAGLAERDKQGRAMIINAEKARKESKKIKAKAHYDRGYDYMVSGKYQQAKDAFQQAIKLNPDYGEAREELKKVSEKLELLRRQQEADRKLRKAKGFKEQGYDYIRLGKYEEAVDAFSKAIEIRPSYMEAYRGLGDTYLKLKNYDGAVKCYKQVVKEDPNDFEAYQNLSDAYSRLGNDEDAEKARKESIRIAVESLYPKYKNKYSLLNGRYHDISEGLSNLWLLASDEPEREAWSIGDVVKMWDPYEVLSVIGKGEYLLINAAPFAGGSVIHVHGIERSFVDGERFPSRMLIYTGTYRYVTITGGRATVRSFTPCKPLTKDQFADAVSKGFVPTEHDESTGRHQKDTRTYRRVTQEDVVLYKDYQVCYLSYVGPTMGGFSLGEWIEAILSKRESNTMKGDFLIKQTSSEIIIRLLNRDRRLAIFLSCSSDSKACLPSKLVTDTETIVDSIAILQVMALFL